MYADENFPLPVVNALPELGHDVVTIHEDGKANQRYPDASVLADATHYQRAVLTVNRKHFWQLHLDDGSHAGIILCTYDPDFADQALRKLIMYDHQEMPP
ncbi:MAG: DUF5615 family PIN-like protein [Anaerolineales bacterium]|nr:DUF5615 family PIN-like protein [Anaerolineales bacterium]